jgi:hypothetical protein
MRNPTEIISPFFQQICERKTQLNEKENQVKGEILSAWEP